MSILNRRGIIVTKVVYNKWDQK